jgi:HEPN domain-containing protein
MIRREAAYRIREAWHDLCTAQLLYSARRFNAAAFYSHQAVEKALESLFFVFLRAEPPRSHVLVELYRELKRAGVELDPALEEAGGGRGRAEQVLHRVAISGRGGQPFEAVTRRDAERALETARAVADLAEGLLARAGYEGTPGDIKSCG